MFQPGESRLHRLHPLTKLVLSGLCLTIAVAVKETWMVAIFYFLIMVPLAALGKFMKQFLLNCVRIIWPFMVSLFPIQGFFGEGTTVLYQIGNFSLKLEGVLSATDYLARILVGIGAAILLMFATRPDHLMQALTEKGVPYQLGYIVVTAMQIVPRFQAKAQMILNAQRSRGLETEGNLFHRLRMLVPLVGPLILGSIIDIEERAIALEARAFTHPAQKTSYRSLNDSSRQKGLRWVLMALMVGLIVLRMWHGAVS